MKTIINTLKAIIVIACIITLSFENSWGTVKWQQQRYAAVGFSIGNKGYIGTGYGYTNNVVSRKKDLWEYNPTTDSWTQKADFGGAARVYAVGFSIGNKGYIGTGTSDSELTKDFWEYNPITNIWIQKANFDGPGRVAAVGFSIGTKGYIGTGQGLLEGNIYNMNDFFEYDPNSNTWTQKANLIGIARYGAVGFNIGEKGYLGTGINGVNSTTYTRLNDFYEYDPSEDIWIMKAPFGGTPRSFAVGFNINTKGYIGTGASSSELTNDFWEYNPTIDTWLLKANFGGTKRSSATGFSIGTKGYIGTGSIGSSVQDFWEYNQSNNLWSKKTDLGSVHKGSLKDVSIIEDSGQIFNEELIVYPNPSNSTFNIRLKTTNEEWVTIQIFDMLGRLACEYKTFSPSDIMAVGHNLKAGAYLAVVTQGELRKIVKIAKVN